MMKNYTLDATDQTLGRLASRTAFLLRGKGAPTFRPQLQPPVTVAVTNVSKLKIRPAKLSRTEYRRYSGYPGGLKSETMAKLAARRGYPELFRQAVKGMLPNNKLRRLMLKRLIISV